MRPFRANSFMAASLGKYRNSTVGPSWSQGLHRIQFGQLPEAGSTCYKGNTETERCKTGKKQTVEDRVTSFEWVAVRDE